MDKRYLWLQGTFLFMKQNSRLDQILDRKHPLFVLANQIDWSLFDAKFGRLYADKERPALSTRLM